MLPDTARGSLGKLVGQWWQKHLAAPISQAEVVQEDNEQLFFPYQSCERQDFTK